MKTGKKLMRCTAAVLSALALCRPLTAEETSAAAKAPEARSTTAGSGLQSLQDKLRSLFAPEESQPEGGKSARYIMEGENGALQVPRVTFEGPGGEKLEFTGVVHIGDKAFYERLNAHLKTFDCVLFELVAGAEDVKTLQSGGKREPKKNQRLPLGELFQMLANNILHLSSQMETINYTQPHFVHADFSDTEMEAALAARGLNPEDLLGGVSPAVIKMVLNLVKVMLPPDDPHAGKRFMAPLMGSAGFGRGGNKMAKAFEEVIIEERDARVMEVLAQQVAAGKKNLSIFYGSGHLADLTERLQKAGWKKTGETWDTAWLIPAKPAVGVPGGAAK